MSHKPIILVIDPSLKNPCTEGINCLAKIVGELSLNLQFKFSHVEYFTPFLNDSRLEKYLENKNIGAVVCLGSIANMTDKLTCVNNLISDIERHILSKNIPFLGICFSHQMLAFMHGYKVDYLKQKEEIQFRKHHRFRTFKILHPKLSLLTTHFKSCDYFSNNGIDLSFKNAISTTKKWSKKNWDLLSTTRKWILNANENRVKNHINTHSLKMLTAHARHEQEVWHLNDYSNNDFELAATSDSCTYEAFVHTSKPTFSLQTHPETQHQDGYLLIKNFIYMSSLL